MMKHKKLNHTAQ